MASYLQKFRTRPSAILITAVFALALITTLTVNAFLFFSKNSIVSALQEYLPTEISVRRIIYLPPWYLSLQGVTLSESSPAAPEEVITLPSVLARFSLLKLIFARKIFFSHINISGPRAAAYGFFKFFRDHYEQLAALIKRLPRQNIKCYVQNFRLRLDSKEHGSSYFSTDLKLTLQGERILSSGVIRQYGPAGQGLPLRFKGRGVLTRDGIDVLKLEVTKANFYAQGWGSLKGDRLKSNGFMFMNTAFQEKDYQEPGFEIIEKVKDYLEGLRASQADVILPRANLYLLDIDCQATFTFPSLQIDKLNFSFNNNPISVKGAIAFTDPIFLDLHSGAYLTPHGEITMESLKKIEVALKGSLQESTFKGEGLLSFNFVGKEEGRPPLQKADASLKTLRVSFKHYPSLQADANDLDLYLRTDSNEYRMYLKDLHAVFSLSQERFKRALFQAQLYDGSLQGQALADMERFPPRISAVARIRAVSANKLAGILVHFSKVFGKLDSLMYFHSHPHLDLEGTMKVAHGYLKNFEFFKWLADFLSLEALRMINFDQASANFSVNPQGASLHEIDLVSPEVGIGGYFILGAKDMVASKLFLRCNKELLKQSPKFAPLVRLVEADVNWLNFDFQLSGNLHAMNFLWLQSDFKRRLEKAIPNFIERRIEKNIETLIEQTSGR